MNLLEAFCNEIGLCPKYYDIKDIKHTPDYSEFNVVDGEESDFGIVKYFDLDGTLLAKKIVHGGDDEDIEFTEYGISLLSPLAIEILNKNILKVFSQKFPD